MLCVKSHTVTGRVFITVIIRPVRMHRIDAAHGICLCIGQLIKILSHGQTRVSLQSHVLDGAHIGTTQPIRLNDLCASVMWSCVVLL